MRPRFPVPSVSLLLPLPLSLALILFHHRLLFLFDASVLLSPTSSLPLALTVYPLICPLSSFLSFSPLVSSSPLSSSLISFSSLMHPPSTTRHPPPALYPLIWPLSPSPLSPSLPLLIPSSICSGSSAMPSSQPHTHARGPSGALWPCAVLSLTLPPRKGHCGSAERTSIRKSTCVLRVRTFGRDSWGILWAWG